MHGTTITCIIILTLELYMYSNAIIIQHLHALYSNLLVVQTKATSCVWVQSSSPIVLAGQLMSILSVPKQRSSSSHVRLEFEDWEKLYSVGSDHLKATIHATFRQ